MDWFPDILHVLQSTSPREILHILLVRDMPYFSENPNHVKNINNYQLQEGIDFINRKTINSISQDHYSCIQER